MTDDEVKDAMLPALLAVTGLNPLDVEVTGYPGQDRLQLAVKFFSGPKRIDFRRLMDGLGMVSEFVYSNTFDERALSISGFLGDRAVDLSMQIEFVLEKRCTT